MVASITNELDVDVEARTLVTGDGRF